MQSVTWPAAVRHSHVQTTATNFVHIQGVQVDRDGSVGIATRYEVDGPGIESRWGARFSAPVQTGPEAHPALLYNEHRVFLREKRPGRGVHHPPHLAPRLKKEYSYTCTPVGLRGLFKDELYLYLL